jgi:hypothetical protein
MKNVFDEIYNNMDVRRFKLRTAFVDSTTNKVWKQTTGSTHLLMRNIWVEIKSNLRRYAKS